MFTILLSLALASESAGIGGFITFNFPYSGNKAELLSQLSVVVKTPQGSLVDTAEVQPTGYWIVPTPSHRELVISVRAPAGLVVSPQSTTVQFPYSNVYFQIQGFSVFGSIVTKGSGDDLIHVAAALAVELTDGNGMKLSNMSNPDGTFVLGPVPSGTYTVSLQDASASSKTVVVTDGSAQCEPLLITDWPQTGTVMFPAGVKPHVVKLALSGAATMTIETNEEGHFSIHGLNVGGYHLKSAVEDVVIAPLSFTISASKLPTPLTLNFEGIKVHGTVTLGDGKPVMGAEVALTGGNYKTVTNENGVFVFPIVKANANPVLSVQMPFYTFDVPAIPAIESTPLADIAVKVIKAKISGKVECPQAVLTFTGGIETEMKVTNGVFAVSAPVGTPVHIKAASDCGFEHKEMTVSAPTDAVKFAKIKASVSGSVICLDKCNTEVAMILKNSQYKYSANIKADGSFIFEEVEFGAYEMTAEPGKHETWRLIVDKVSVDEKLVSVGTVMEQTGLYYNVTASHHMVVRSGDEVIFLARGLNGLRSTSTIVESFDCHKFAPVDVSKQPRIVTQSIERTVVVNGDGKYEVFLNGAVLPAPYQFLQKSNEKYVVEIKSEAPYYPEPASIEVPMIESCEDAEITFDVIRGVEFQGRVTPATAGIAVTAVSGTKTISTAVTNENGVYSLGSFPSNMEVTLTAVKEGYKITRVGTSFDFTVEKLSSLEVSFQYDTNVNTKGILLSLSRADGFAQNVMTTGDDVTVIRDLEAGEYFLKPIFREHQFTPAQISLDLKQGTSFKADFSILRVKFGITGVVKRVTGESEPDVEIEAIHANGDRQTTVTDASGRFRIGGLSPNQTVTLLARASTTASIDRVTPSQMKIKMGNEEYKGVKFLSMKTAHAFDIMGELNIEPDFLPKMNVVLMTNNNQVVERFAFPSKASNFFYFTNLTGDSYTIVVANTDRQMRGSVTCPKQEVAFKYPHANVEIVCQTTQTHVEAEEEAPVIASAIRASVIAFLAILGWIVFFNFNTLKAIIGDMFKNKKKKSKRN